MMEEPIEETIDQIEGDTEQEGAKDTSTVTDTEQVESSDSIVDDSSDKVKEIARGMGWIDPKNYKGDPDKYVDAETYIRKTHDINHGLRKQIKEITNVVKELKLHNERVYKAELKRLETEIAELKAQRRAAIEDGDVERVEKIEKQIDDVKASVDINPPVSQTNPVWDEWIEENPWYDTDKEMRKFADEAGKEYAGLPFDKILKLVRKDVMAEFPEKFKKPEKTRPGASPVESGARRTASKTPTKADLTPTQRNIMNQFVRHGVMTEAEYIADLVKRGEI